MIYSAIEQETLQRSRKMFIDSNIQFRSHEKFHTNDDLLRYWTRNAPKLSKQCCYYFVKQEYEQSLEVVDLE